MLSGIIDKYDKRHKARIERELKEHESKREVIRVKYCKLQSILKEFPLSNINYLSIDTEGGELDILKSLDLKNLNIDVISVENNCHCFDFLRLLKKFDYKLVATANADEIYKKYHS